MSQNIAIYVTSEAEAQ